MAPTPEPRDNPPTGGTINYQDYEQYDRTALAAIWQQRANALGAEIEHGHERPARARGDHRAADAYAAEDAAVRRDYRRIMERGAQIATMRRWDARLAELKAARAEPARHASWHPWRSAPINSAPSGTRRSAPTWTKMGKQSTDP